MSAATTPASTASALHVDADIRVASTLDTSFYLDESLYALARERIFARSWQWLGGLADVAAPASLSPREMLPGLLDEPLLLARDSDGVLRCLSNVCTHRGNLLLHGACRADAIRCGYHSRRFDLSGRMTSMPAFEKAEHFPTPRDDLPQLPFGTFGGHAFASLAPAAPLQAFIGDVQSRLPWPIDRFEADPSRSRDYEFDAHWALYVDNYLEGLHIPFVHAGLAASLDADDYRHELGRYASLQVAAARAGEPAFDDLPAGSPDRGQRIAAYYWWVFPNLMLNVYPWGLSLNLVQPLGPARTRVLFRSFVHDAGKLGLGAGSGLDQVEMEDEAIVQAVQRGIRSRLYTRSRYSPTAERGVHHFHRLIGEFMAG